MDSDAFDDLTARLASRLTRRRSIVGLGALGLGSVVANEAADAKHKKKKKKKSTTTTPAPTTTLSPQCAACTACETCVNGVCQPRAAGAACSGTSVNSACLPAVNSARNVCVDLDGICEHTACNGDADCQAGETCVDTRQNANCALWFYCSPIIPA